MRKALRAVRAWSRYRDEALHSLALLGGWTALTAGVAHLTSSVAWLFSAGLLGFALAGFQHTATLAWKGLYALTRRG